ncbi:uncharacterized protein LOC131646104 [Vicia villosa]|uniref:uncharacterized protein LOC131646104 n=1 Tax=Vicia villosa TaxID=3911 RepID=UPI00273B7FC2|nr:uncharacterized protein LOC131646104 [Vicia villosa]
MPSLQILLNESYSLISLSIDSSIQTELNLSAVVLLACLNELQLELFKETDVIISNEAPMAHKNYFEALDKTLNDVMTKKGLGNKIFGGKVVVFEGDFRQILPVVPRAGHSDIVHASICSSYIWDYCQILNVGDGKIPEPNDGLVDIEIPQELLVTNFEDPIKAIVESTYLNLVHVFQDVAYLQGKTILASTIEVMDKIREEKEYLSYDSIDRTDTSYNEAYEVLTPEFLSKLRTSGLPNHRIKLKVGTLIMLMRNLDQTDGLCNGTWLIVTRLANHVIEEKIMSGKNIERLDDLSSKIDVIAEQLAALTTNPPPPPTLTPNTTPTLTYPYLE